MSIYEELRALDDLDEPRSLRFASTGLPLWPYVRWIAFSAAADHVLGLQPAFATSAAQTLRQRAELVLRSQLRGPQSVHRRFDVVMVGSSAGLIERDGRWFDRINDYFALEHADGTLVLDKALHGTYKTPRVPPHVRCFDTFDIRASIAARMRRPSDADLTAIDRLVAFVRSRFPISLPEGELERIRAALVFWALRLPLLRSSFARFFESVKPRVLFVEDGSYGASAHLNTWARTAGIATAELQHGLISRSHLAYNYGDAARADDATIAALPQYLLLYGEFWRHEVRTPSEPVIAGCPHFSENRPARTEGRTVLTISQGICTEAMVRTTSALARRFPEERFVFRPHPGELAFRDRYAALAELPNVEINERGDLYPRLAEARIVIGHSSTALVEAAGVGLPVCVLDEPASRAIIPADVGTWFRTIDELAPLVAAPRASTAAPDHFFAPDWRGRYRAFITHVAS